MMAIMGRSSTSMAQRYQRVAEPMLNDASAGRSVRLCGVTSNLARRSPAKTPLEAQNPD
ncbi:hypothetical protein WN990_01285 [Kitasatospora purpeofusca]|uniref:hypothetical protein n=1 Tax=Kitasatospora purpeofusca TaxID=67352 RepID=UPI0030F217B2